MSRHAAPDFPVPGTLPHYYTSLAAFREVFAAGLPILTYHKLGPRPRGVRLKGLYVSSALFERQLDELRRAGFGSGSLTRDCPAADLSEAPGALQAGTGKAQGRRPLVITFDDGFRNAFQHAVPALARHGFQAIQFLVSDSIGKTNTWEQAQGEAAEALMDEGEVRAWIAAGHCIGSHTRTHPWLTRLPVAAAREELTSSRRSLEDRFGVAIEHFCYPYGDWNAAVRDLVAVAGYRTACTVEAGVNTRGVDRLALKRFTARYRSRKFKELRAWLTSWWTRAKG